MCLLGTWGGNWDLSSHSVFSIAQWNRNYQSHFTDRATGLWRSRNLLKCMPLIGGKKHWNLQSLRFVCSTSPSLMRWPGLWLGIWDYSQCSALASWAPAYPSGLQPDLFPRLSPPLCVQWPSSPPFQLESESYTVPVLRWLNSLEMWFHSSFLETIRPAIVISHLGEILGKKLASKAFPFSSFDDISLPHGAFVRLQWDNT